MHKQTWEVKRGDVFSLFDRSGKKVYMINGKHIIVEMNSKGRFVLLNDLPEIKGVR